MAGSKVTASEGGNQITPKVVRPSSETNTRSPVVAKSAAREPGMESATAPKASPTLARTPGSSMSAPSGSCTTWTIGPATSGPPLP